MEKEKDFFDEITVVKRSGQRVNFNDTKVAIAIKKGFDSVYEEYDEKEVNKVKEKVLDYIKKEYKDRKTIGVEDVSDAIEVILQKSLKVFLFICAVSISMPSFSNSPTTFLPNSVSLLLPKAPPPKLLSKFQVKPQ